MQIRPAINNIYSARTLREKWERRIYQAVAFISSSLALHVVTPIAIDHVQRGLRSGRPLEEEQIRSALEAMDKPEIVMNSVSPGDRRIMEKELAEVARAGERHLAQFRKTGRSEVNYGKFFIPFEYYAQRLATKSYLMPKETKDQLLAIYDEDRELAGAIVRSDQPRQLKFSQLVQLVHARSTYDPGANTIPSLLVPEGGQNCFSRLHYLLALISPFSAEILRPGERFVSARNSGHAELGIYNSLEKKLLLISSGEITDRWLADLYDPHVEVQIDLDVVLKGGLRPKDAYDGFLVARANQEGARPPAVMVGRIDPLPLNQGGVSSPWTKDPTGRQIRGREVEKRQPPSPELLARRIEKIKRELGITPPSQPMEVYLIKPAELEQLHLQAGHEARGHGDYKRAFKEYDNVLKMNPHNCSAYHGRAIAREELGDPKGAKEDLSQALGDDYASFEAFKRLNNNLSFSYGWHTTGRLRFISVGAGVSEKHRIEIIDLSPLVGLAELERLYLSDVKIHDLRPLARMTWLKKLDLRDNNINDLAPIAGLIGLRDLYLEDMPASDLRPLAGLVGLEKLTLSRMPARDISPLAGLTRLKELTLFEMQVTDLSPLAGLTELEEAYLPEAGLSREAKERFAQTHPKLKDLDWWE